MIFWHGWCVVVALKDLLLDLFRIPMDKDAMVARLVWDWEVEMVMEMSHSLYEVDCSRRGEYKVRWGYSNSAVSSAEEERLHDAVQYIMKLAHGNSLESGLTHKHIHEEYEATNSNSLNNNQVSESKKLRIEESPVGYRSDYPVQKLKIDERGSTDDAGNSGLNSEYIEKSNGKAVLGTGYIPENSVTLSLNCQWVNTDWHREDDYKNFPDDDELESRPMVMIKNKKKRRRGRS
ncbi:hypothetical protein F0562_027655 [Nyssa sinensis]|uniref:Uncharacterized protein n=1 Tax=Nyssa sinensis TaxID=561372 RepID=A0A5J5B376_9ASTE|nr:hypothetical protein F0562_027655 [Nyssa sinensis]